MDGLECCEVMFSSTLTTTDYFRLESEYYNAKTFSFSRMAKGAAVIYGVQYGTSKLCDENSDGYPVLRLNELHNGFIDKPQKYCHILAVPEYKSLCLKEGDVVIIRTNGNPDLVGKAAVIMEDSKCAFASYLYRVFPNGQLNPYTIVAFMSGKYGRMEIDKNSMKGNQTNFSSSKFGELNFPLLGKDLQDKIKNIFKEAYIYRSDSEKLYSMAQNILMKNLNLYPSSISSKGTTQKNLSESFGSTGRLDAEYYLPKYDDICALLKTTETVGSLCHIYDANYLPKSNTEYRYIELANVGNNGAISDVKTILGKDLPSRARRRVTYGQVLISSVEGSLKSCSVITDENDGALCSTGFYVLDSDNINSETLLVLFQSEPIQALLKQRCSGTILTAISKDDFLNVPLPVIRDNVQQEITEKVQESFSLRRQAESLIQTAIRSVEIAIESDEAAALQWIEETFHDLH